MTPVLAERAIKDALSDAVAPGFGAAAIAWPNIPFNPALSVSPQWVKVDLIWGNGFIGTKGAAGINFTVGVLQVMCFERKDTSDENLLVLAETIRFTFNRLRLETDIVFAAPSGPRWSFEDSWRVATVTCPFTLHEGV